MDFELPYALDGSDLLVSQANGRKGTVYSCPGCKEKVTFKSGEIIHPHFAHYPNVSCSKEAVLNRIGQRLLLGQIEASIKGSMPLPRLDRVCKGECKSVRQVRLPANAVRALPDYQLPTGEVVDMVLLDAQENPLLVIDIEGIRHGDHPVEGRARGIPWVAVKGSDIIAQGTSWFVETSDGCEDCPDCLRLREERKRHEEERAEYARRIAEIQAKNSPQRFANPEEYGRQAEYERSLKILGDKSVQRKPLDYIGLWKWGSFTLLMKPRSCKNGHRTAVWTWPDGNPFGEIPSGMEGYLPSLWKIELEDRHVYSSKCRICLTPLFETPMSSTAATKPSDLGDSTPSC